MSTRKRPARWCFAVLLWLCVAAHTFAQQNYLPGVHPGKPSVEIRLDGVTVRNEILSARWSLTGKHLRGAFFSYAFTKLPISLPENCFSLVFRDGRTVSSALLSIVDEPRIEDLPLLSVGLLAQLLPLSLRRGAGRLDLVFQFGLHLRSRCSDVFFGLLCTGGEPRELL